MGCERDVALRCRRVGVWGEIEVVRRVSSDVTHLEHLNVFDAISEAGLQGVARGHHQGRRAARQAFAPWAAAGGWTLLIVVSTLTVGLQARVRRVEQNVPRSRQLRHAACVNGCAPVTDKMVGPPHEGLRQPRDQGSRAIPRGRSLVMTGRRGSSCCPGEQMAEGSSRLDTANGCRSG